MDPTRPKTVLVTGSTDGMGRQLVRDLAAGGATILVHGRSRERGEAVLEELRGIDARTQLYIADFASLDQVRGMVEQVRGDHDSIDVLVNNAGLGAGPAGSTHREVSQDGLELRFQVGYLAAFALTQGLLDLLLASEAGRVVNVASVGQHRLDFDDLMIERGYDGMRAYGQSKLALIMHAFELAGRVEGLTANALHPASLMDTKMVYETFGYTLSTVADGARNTARLALDPALAKVSGRYFDQNHEARADSQAYDPRARATLWEVSEQLLGLGNASTR